MSLLSLPSEVLHHLCSNFLCPQSVFELSQTCKQLYALLASDQRVWILLARHRFGLNLDSCADSKFTRAVVMRLLDSPLYKGSGKKRLWLRKNFGSLSGLFQVVYSESSLYLVHWQSPLDPDVYSPLKALKVAQIYIDPSTMEVRSKLMMSYQKEVDAKLDFKKIDEKTINFSLTFDNVKYSDYYVEMIQQQMSRYPIPAQSLMQGFFSMNNIKSYVFGHYQENHSNKGDPWAEQIFAPYIEKSLKSDKKLPISPGLFKGTYGFHGIELIEVAFDADDNDFFGTKITGDPNVPVGSVTFRAKLRHALCLESEEEQGSFEQLRHLCLNVESDERVLDFEQVPQRMQPFVVPEACHMRCELNERMCRYRFVCECRVAHMGFINPEWINGHLVVFNDDLFAVLFLQIQAMSLFHRVNNDFMSHDVFGNGDEHERT